MLPVVGVPKTVQQQMRPYRDLFQRSEGFEHVSRYVTWVAGQSEQDFSGNLCHASVGREETPLSDHAGGRV